MKNLLPAFLIFFSLAACSKEEQEQKTLCMEGLIRWEGNPAADGLGWTFRKATGESFPIPYVLESLSQQYQTDNLPVSICLVKSNEKLYCQCVEPLSKYKITFIKKL